VIEKRRSSSKPSFPAVIDTRNASEKTPLRQKPKRELQMELGESSRVLYTKEETPENHRRPTCFKTTIEKWRPVGDEKIHCPRCESFKRPIVRTHTERVTQSSLKSTLMMTCWPLCFAPCLFPPPTHEKLCCRVCNFYFGIYDHKNQKVLVNPELLEEK
jgi:LITAF-like zinc ribbon domain